MSIGPLHAEARTRTLTGVQILGTGRYLPDNVVTNHDLLASHGFDPEWIVNRTGITERRFALPHQATSDLCRSCREPLPEGRRAATLPRSTFWSSAPSRRT